MPEVAEKDLDEYLTIEEVSRWLKVPISWVYERVRKNEIPYVRLLKKYLRFNRRELEAWLKGLAHNQN